jgi:hypothetical protein
MNEREKRRAEFEALEREQARKREEFFAKLAPDVIEIELQVRRREAEELADQIWQLKQKLEELDLVDDTGVVKWKIERGTNRRVAAIEDPASGRLYGFVGADLVATRVRPDGQYEHAVIDENGEPREWETTVKPQLN